jgi:hypothetical protein
MVTTYGGVDNYKLSVLDGYLGYKDAATPARMYPPFPATELLDDSFGNQLVCGG